MIEAKTLTYYQFDDVQKYICVELGIEMNQFRDYHKVVGGKYKDFWHVWLDLHYGEITNGSYVSLWFDCIPDRLKELESQYGDWILVLVPVLEKLEQEVDSDSIIIHYWW